MNARRGAATGVAALAAIVALAVPAAADHDQVTCTAGADIGCVHLHGAAPNVLGDLAVLVADELEARTLTVASDGPGEPTSAPQEVWVSVDEDWRYAGLLFGGAVLAMLAALVVGQMRRAG